MRKSTYTKDGVTMPSKTAAPVVTVAGITITDGLPTVIVTLRLAELKATSRFKNFCRQIDPIGFEAIDLERAVYVCSGHPDRLETLIRQDFIREWHHDVNIRVCRNDKELAREKIVDNTIVSKVISTVRSKDNEVIAVKSRDIVSQDTKDNSKLRLHGDMTLDQIEERKAAELRKEQELWWGKMGMKPPKD